ncbi:hypothetical protein CCP3SC1_10067 [Gammaproteobacteria bacterium]
MVAAAAIDLAAGAFCTMAKGLDADALFCINAEDLGVDAAFCASAEDLDCGALFCTGADVLTVGTGRGMFCAAGFEAGIVWATD